MLEFPVKDTGIGIPADQHDIIFKRFGQVLNTRERNLGGTGLGLAISKNLSHLLGGDMWMISAVGEGTTFYFTIPDQRVSITEPVKAKIPSIPGQFDWRDKTILVAEDFEPNYMFIEAGLLNTRARIIWAKDGQEAIDVMKNHKKIDAVLMDIQMPRIDGLEATRQIKQMKPEVPVIAQTAYAMENDREKFIAAGCDDYISKPIKLGILLNTLDQHMNPQV
jgi:CheY-like chemotaxis protein